MSASAITFEPIGVVRSSFVERADAPRQPEYNGLSASNSSDAERGHWVELLPHKNYEQALADLEGFERIWLLSWFHRNAHWKPKVLPPRGRTKRGVFATRAPYRPNPIGLSLVRLLCIQGLHLLIGECDLLDGTPILDIKPYIPAYDAFVSSRVGWLEHEMLSPPKRFDVRWMPLADEQMDFLEREGGVRLKQRFVPRLEEDPFPHPYRRIERIGMLRVASADDANHADYYEQYVIAYKAWRLRYYVIPNEYVVMVERVFSGYSVEALSDEGDEELHRRFWKQFGSTA